MGKESRKEKKDISGRRKHKEGRRQEKDLYVSEGGGSKESS